MSLQQDVFTTKDAQQDALQYISLQFGCTVDQAPAICSTICHNTHQGQSRGVKFRIGNTQRQKV